MVIVCLLSYCVISNHYVTGSIIVMDFKRRSYLSDLLNLMKVPIRPKHILFQGFVSALLAGNLPYFLFDLFVS